MQLVVAVPPALHGCEAIVLDDAPHGTSLDNPTCAFRNRKFEMGDLGTCFASVLERNSVTDMHIT